MAADMRGRRGIYDPDRMGSDTVDMVDLLMEGDKT